jgi:hypothetical protein
MGDREVARERAVVGARHRLATTRRELTGVERIVELQRTVGRSRGCTTRPNQAGKPCIRGKESCGGRKADSRGSGVECRSRVGPRDFGRDGHLAAAG